MITTLHDIHRIGAEHGGVTHHHRNTLHQVDVDLKIDDRTEGLAVGDKNVARRQKVMIVGASSKFLSNLLKGFYRRILRPFKI